MATPNAAGLDDVLDALDLIAETLAGTELPAKLGAFLTLAIKERTKKGLDVYGASFAPYTQRYARYRVSKGRGTRPNLLWSGTMLAALTFTVEAGQVVLGFMDATQEAKALGNTHPNDVTWREFFALSDEDLDKAVEIIRHELLGGFA